MYTRWFGFTLQAMQAALASENVRKNSDFCVVKLTSAYCIMCSSYALTYIQYSTGVLRCQPLI